MINTDTITVDQMMATVASRCAQENAQFRSRGFYVGAVRDCLRELAYVTLFDKQHFIATIPDSLVIPLPRGFADMENLWLFNGTECDFDDSKNIYWHVGMRRHGGGNYFAENKYVNDDPIIEDAGFAEPTNLYSYNIQNGNLMLSSSCKPWEKIYMVYAGLGQTAGKDPEIPTMLMPAVEDFVAHRCLQYLAARTKENTYRGLMNDAYKMYYTPFTGSRDRCKHLVRRVHTKMLRDYAKYNTTFGYSF